MARITLSAATLLGSLVLNSVSSNAGWFGPSDFDECILESMKGVTSDRAARIISRSCWRKYPKKKPTSRPLSYDEIANLTGRASFNKTFETFDVQIYNGNEDITLTFITLSIEAIFYNQNNIKQYNSEISISPLTTEKFKIRMLPGHDDGKYSWKIISAKATRIGTQSVPESNDASLAFVREFQWCR